MSTRYVTFEDSLLVIAAVLGGDPLDRVRDIALLRSAIERPAMTLYGRDAYADIPTKAAALLHSVLRNHALLDGNKRTGWILCALFFELNGYEERYSEDAMFTFITSVAAGTIEDIGDIARQLAAWFQPRLLGDVS